VTTGDAAYWQTRAENLERERDEARRYGRKWHTVALAALAAMRCTHGLLHKQSPKLVGAFEAIIERQDGIAPMACFLESAVAVARLNIDRYDSIRPMTNGAVVAYEQLETALLLAELAEVEETEYTALVRQTVWRKRNKR